MNGIDTMNDNNGSVANQKEGIQSSSQDQEMTSVQDLQRDELHTALHQRLVQTGEWHRIMASLRSSLDESGWSASLREQAQTQASQQQKLNLPDLIEDLTPFAEKTIPLQVRNQITAMLHDFVARNVEDA